MKKNVLRILAGIMTVFMMFAMTACSEPAQQPVTEIEQPVADGEEPATEPDQPVADGEEPVTEPEQPAADGEKPVTELEQPNAEDVKPAVESDAAKAVAAYVEACRGQVAEMNTDDTFEIKVVAKDTAVVYQYTYNSIDNLSDDERDFMKKSLEDEVDKNKETVQKSLETIKSEEPNVTAMVFEYYEKSGKLIASIEIK